MTEPRAPIPAGDVLMLDSAIGAAGRYEARLEASGGLAEADEHRGGTLSPLAAFSEKLCHYKGAWGREKRPLAERQRKSCRDSACARSRYQPMARPIRL